MNLDEAYRTLGVTPEASKDEVSKAFKKLAAEHHPDSSKSPDEAKFKEINAAKQVIDNPPPEPQGFQPGQHTYVQFNMETEQSGPKQYPEPIIDVHLTFEESVLGAKRKITYDRYVKCEECRGQRFIVGSNVCSKCQGQGHTVVTAGGHIRMVRQCGTCHGTGKETTDCVKCNGDGVKKQSVTQDIQLPFPLQDGQLIRGAGSGNFRGTMAGMFGGGKDVYGNAIIRITVDADPDMSLDETGENIQSTIKLTLVEALKGINKKVRTLKGELTLKIRPASKNGQQIVAGSLGPGYIGNHIFVLDVEYPTDTAELIEFLEKQEN